MPLGLTVLPVTSLNLPALPLGLQKIRFFFSAEEGDCKHPLFLILVFKNSCLHSTSQNEFFTPIFLTKQIIPYL